MVYTLDTSIGFRLNRAANIVHAGFSKCLEPYGIAPEQFATLKIISEDGDINLSDLADMLAKGKPTVSRALDALEKKGLIVRESRDSDRRVKAIRLSGKGRAVLEAVEPKALTFNEAIRARLAPGEAETFFHVLDTIIDTAEQHSPEGN